MISVLNYGFDSVVVCAGCLSNVYSQFNVVKLSTCVFNALWQVLQLYIATILTDLSTKLNNIKS